MQLLVCSGWLPGCCCMAVTRVFWMVARVFWLVSKVLFVNVFWVVAYVFLHSCNDVQGGCQGVAMLFMWYSG